MTASTAPRVIPLPETTRVPVYAVPTRRTRVRIGGQCPACGCTSFVVEWPDEMTPTHVSVVARVVCLLGSHEVAILAIGGSR